jgi:hypothetical protein
MDTVCHCGNAMKDTPEGEIYIVISYCTVEDIHRSSHVRLCYIICKRRSRVSCTRKFPYAQSKAEQMQRGIGLMDERKENELGKRDS